MLEFLLTTAFVRPHAARGRPRAPRRVWALMQEESESAAHANLIIMRHGQSEWNLANRFTGWVDVDLTERGIVEARQALSLIHI